MCGHGGSGGETGGVQGGEKVAKPNASHIQLPLCFSERLLIGYSIIFRKKD